MSTQQPEIIIDELRRKILQFQPEIKVEKVGYVTKISDGIALISGLTEVMASEMVDFEVLDEKNQPVSVRGVVLNLESDQVGAIIFGRGDLVKAGTVVKSTGRILQVPVGPQLAGRVVNSLGEPLDGQGPIKTKEFYNVERVAPGVMDRQSVNQPLQTGLKAIDAMVPIGRGQRELIIGDRQTGKTAIAIDTIISQRGQGAQCFYVAIGQKESKVAQLVAKLKDFGAMDYTTVIVASAAETAAMSYIAPYAGCAMAEYVLENGQDALIIYDDLSKHAVAYREISLLLRRPPGREAYPGDVFYLHSRLLERACKLSAERGGGSLTALPIIETQAGDISAYIPTNVISITDGQIFLEPDLFYKGLRPAINAGLSVSRVGSSAQTKAMKKVAGKLRLELAQFRELEAFASFGSDLDEATKQKLELGRRLTEILKQGQYQPLTMADQTTIFYAAISGRLAEVPVEKIGAWETDWLTYWHDCGQELAQKITTSGQLDEAAEQQLAKLLEDFLAGWLK